MVSTGESIRAMGELVDMAGGRVVQRAAILLEGEERSGIIHLGILPLFKKDS